MVLRTKSCVDLNTSIETATTFNQIFHTSNNNASVNMHKKVNSAVGYKKINNAKVFNKKKGIQCHFCKKEGHIQRECRLKQRQNGTVPANQTNNSTICNNSKILTLGPRSNSAKDNTVIKEITINIIERLVQIISNQLIQRYFS